MKTRMEECADNLNNEEIFGRNMSAMADMAYDFALERDWVKYDKPRNLLLAMLTEVGELGDLYQWKEAGSEISPKMLNETAQELDDVAIYLMRLSRACGVEVVVGLKSNYC